MSRAGPADLPRAGRPWRVSGSRRVGAGAWAGVDVRTSLLTSAEARQLLPASLRARRSRGSARASCRSGCPEAPGRAGGGGGAARGQRWTAACGQCPGRSGGRCEVHSQVFGEPSGRWFICIGVRACECGTGRRFFLGPGSFSVSVSLLKRSGQQLSGVSSRGGHMLMEAHCVSSFKSELRQDCDLQVLKQASILLHKFLNV